MEAIRGTLECHAAAYAGDAEAYAMFALRAEGLAEGVGTITKKHATGSLAVPGFTVMVTTASGAFQVDLSFDAAAAQVHYTINQA